MKLYLDCIPCFQRQALEAARMVTDDEEKQEEILRRAIKELLDLNWDRRPTEIAHKIHGMVKEMSGDKDPYREVKKKYNDLALALYPALKEQIKRSNTPLLTAVRLSIAGNVIDFGASSNFDIHRTIDEVLVKEFAISDYKKFVERLERARKIIYLADNAGEIVFDKLLLETILSRYEIGKIIFVVKATPIINDAMYEDAIYVGIDKIPNIEFMEIGAGSDSGITRESKTFLDMLKESDIAISKGQGNYESLSNVDGIFFLLMAKCPVIARDLGVEMGDIILKGS
ncbi:MAG: DUF89 family protein [Candidatus Methanolliviera hydrocarbonicum]|uniref:DUF89 family protein n=1 Tax=Candidatus Methanolliviera hydrocarbonicum TaxID=2491085 RepID=A0A520KYD0_9EURY|nr:MAG: DUF89 family protein [Candidatus Methanolliviera hydrocarbonicum]